MGFLRVIKLMGFWLTLAPTQSQSVCVQFEVLSYGMRQYNVIVPFLQNETKTERPFPLYETPHSFRRNGWTVLKQSQNDSSLNRTMKKDSHPVTTPLCPLQVLKRNKL